MKKISIFVLCALCLMIGTAHAQNRFYVANNVPVLIEGPSSVETRDQAIIKAQRLALNALAGGTQAEQLKAITDTILSRTMKDFSLQNERVLPQSYQARFTIRFDAMRFDGMLRTYNLTTPSVQMVDLKDMPLVADPLAAQAPAVAGETDPANPENPAVPTAPVADRVIILPVLKSGEKFLLWDDGNFWREAWQNKTELPGGFALTVPLGDADDLADVPQAGAIKPMTDKQPGFDRMLERYQAHMLYVASARVNPTTSLLDVTLYRYKNKHMEKMGGVLNTKSQPGHMFDGAVPTISNQIATFEKPTPTPTPSLAAVAATTTTPVGIPAPTTAPQPVLTRGSILAVVPVSNLSMWITTQQRLRRVEHVTNIVAESLTTNQAIIRIHADGPVSDLISALQANGFTVSQDAGGRYRITQ